MRFLVLWIALSALSAMAEAQTVINAVLDAASYAPRVAPGALATIFGANLANSTQGATGFPLPHSMAGATVYVNQSPVPLLYVSNTQINFQVPSGLAAGTANMYITRSGGQSSLFQFTVVPDSPAIFQDTSNHAIAQNLVDYSLNSSSNPVASGATVIVYLTGQGAVDHPVSDASPTPVTPLATATATATATIGGVDATVQFLGLTPGFVGLAQANITVPALATADYPLVLTVGGYVSASAIVSVSGSGSAPPTYLTQVGQVNFANGASSSLAIYGDTTYVCGPNRIVILNTSDVTMPAYVGEFGDTNLIVSGVGYGGKCALNTTTSLPILVDIVGPPTNPTFAIYSLANPTFPTLLSQLSATPYTFFASISFLGTTAYLSTSWFQNSGNSVTAQYGNFVAYDFSNLIPAPIGILSTGPGSSGSSVIPNSLAIAPGNYPNTAYLTSTTASGNSTNGLAALDVVNISSPQSMQGVYEVTVSDAAIFLGFGYDNPLLLVTGNTTGFRNPGVPNYSGVLDFNIHGNLTLTTMNITNVDAPVVTTTITTQIPTTGTYVVQPFGSSIFAIVNNPPASDPAGPSSLWIVDATTSSSPVLYPVTTQFGMTDVSEANGYLLAPNVNGLTIYSIQTP
jgi:uncharacterized protein (TIGR03437 family)